jgi:hypothetical protein
MTSWQWDAFWALIHCTLGYDSRAGRFIMAKSGKKGNVVTCSSGIEVLTRPVSVKLLELFELNHQAPEPPTMEADVVGGGVELIPKPDDAAYQSDLQAFNKKSTDDFLSMILELGVDIELPDDESWAKRLKRMGVAIPDDEDEKRLLYIQTIIMQDFLNDLQLIAASVLRQSGVTEEAISSWVSLF